MSAITMPGFTAETSLYQSSRSYQSAGSFTRFATAISPAQGGEPVEVVDLGDLDIGLVTKWGVVAGSRNEDKFDDCLTRCQNSPWHPTDSQCWQSCCQELTGHDVCFIA